MSKSTHQLEVKGVDKTAGAFASISARAKAASAKMRSMLGGAFAAAGAYLGTRAITGTINELGRLSDLAMKSGMSVEELTKASTAFQVAGLNISVDSLAKSMQYLNKSTGKSGMGAFFETVKTISEIEDPAQRGAEAVKSFGRSGMELQPLIDGGHEAVQKFQDLISIMPSLSTSAANAGDAVADAMTIASNGTVSIWQKAIGYVCGLWADGFPGGVRAGALNAVNWIETFAKKTIAWFKVISADVMAFGALLYDVVAVGPEQAWETFTGTLSAANDDFTQSMISANSSREDYVSKLKTMNVDDLAGAFDKKKSGSAAPIEKLAEAAGKMTKVANQLVMGDSNDARKLATFGPQLQSETKKHTDLLEKIAENTEGTKDAVQDQESGEVWNGN